MQIIFSFFHQAKRMWFFLGMWRVKYEGWREYFSNLAWNPLKFAVVLFASSLKTHPEIYISKIILCWYPSNQVRFHNHFIPLTKYLLKLSNIFYIQILHFPVCQVTSRRKTLLSWLEIYVWNLWSRLQLTFAIIQFSGFIVVLSNRNHFTAAHYHLTQYTQWICFYACWMNVVHLLIELHALSLCGAWHLLRSHQRLLKMHETMLDAKLMEWKWSTHNMNQMTLKYATILKTKQGKAWRWEYRSGSTGQQCSNKVVTQCSNAVIRRSLNRKSLGSDGSNVMESANSLTSEERPIWFKLCSFRSSGWHLQSLSTH